MAVVPFVRAVRALLSAHLRIAFNSVLRDAGLGVTIVAAVGFVALWLTLAVPLVVLFFVIGLSTRQYELIPPIVFGVGPLAAALFTLLTGEGRELDWEKLKAYPVPPRALFAAELLASVVHPIALVAVGCFVTAGAGQVHGGADVARTGVVVATAVAMLVAVRVFVSTVAGWLVARAQTGAVLTFMIAPALVLWAVERGEDASTMLFWATGALSVLPATLQQSGNFESLSGLAQLFAPALLPLMLLVLTYRLAFREVAPVARRTRGVERLWSFTSPAIGLARLHVTAVMSSEIGRFTVVMPVLWVVPILLLRGRLSSVLNGDALFFAVWTMTPTMLLNLVLNQFGADRGAVKALMLLPVSERELLRGKALGMAFFMVANGLALSPLAYFVARPSLASLPHGPLVATAVFLVQLSIGQFASVLWPRPLPRKGLRQPPGGLIVGLVSVVTVIGMVLPLALLWWALADVPQALTAVLATLCVALFGVFVASSRLAEQFLAARRERVVETLS